jgi:hypothetical protein
MKRTTLFLAFAALISALVGLRPAAADPVDDWNDLRDAIVATLSGHARADLVAATDAIEYAESYGSDEDLLDAYKSWGTALIQHMTPGGTGVTDLQANTLNADFISASQANRFPVLGIWGQAGKACDYDFHSAG